MKSFLHGLGGGLGRGIGRFIAILAISFLIYFIVDLLDLDIKNDIVNRVLMLNVSAKEQVINVNFSARPYMPCSSSGGTNTYCVQDNNNNSIVRTKGNTYNGVLLDLTFQFQQQLNTSMASQFVIDIYGMSTDFRNNNFSALFYSSAYYDTIGSLGNFTYSFVSKSQVRLIVYPDNLTYHTIILSGTPLTGVNTYGIKKVTITYDDGQQDNSGIINNQNQNTQDIIDNNNSNTEDINNNISNNFTNLIDKGVSNMLNELNSQRTQVSKMCTNAYDIPVKIGKRLNNSGNEVDSPNTFYSDFVNLGWVSGTHTRIRIENPSESSSTYILVAYDSNYEYLGRINLATRNWNLPSGATYIRFASPVSNTMIFADGPCVSSGDITNDLINDDSVDNNQANSFFNDFEDDDHGLSAIITLPLTTIQSLTSTQCVALQLPIPFTNETISLPCMSEIYQSKVPGIYNLWQIVCYGLIGYWIGTDIFKLVKGFKDPEEDKIEVVDL